MDQCIFCQIIKGEAPASIVYEDDGATVTWPVKRPPRETLEQYATQVRAALAR
jgi:hypothetical protein